jgi:predicted phage tail protein
MRAVAPQRRKLGEHAAQLHHVIRRPGIYAGRYLVRVRAINAAEISSGWGYSEEKTLTGKVGNPPKPVGFTPRH